MAARKNNADFTVTVVPEVPAAVKTSTRPAPPVPPTAAAPTKSQLDKKLAQAQAELAAAKAQLAAANAALANLQAPAAQKAERATPSVKAKAHLVAVPPASSAADDSEELQFKVDVPTSTHPSAVKEAVKKSKVQPKPIKIDLEGDHAKLPEKSCDAGNRLANPAALACGDYLHGEIEPDEEDLTATEMYDVPTSMHQGVVFNLSSYASAAVAPALRRLGAFGIDAAITVALSFLIMPASHVKYWANFSKDMYQALVAWLDGPIFKLGFVINTVANGKFTDLSFNWQLFGDVLRSYLPMFDLKGVIIAGFVWGITTTVALGFWDSTLGQKLLHLKIVHIHRDHLGWPWALLRQVVYLPLSIFSVVGVIMGLLGSKRCWHDYLSGSKVTMF